MNVSQSFSVLLLDLISAEKQKLSCPWLSILLTMVLLSFFLKGHDADTAGARRDQS
jgi:hypothetical protein